MITLFTHSLTVCTTFFRLLTVLTSFVKGNIHICFPLFNIRSLKIVISIVVYLNRLCISHAMLCQPIVFS